MDTVQEPELQRRTLNKGYIKTLPGILKVCQIVLAFFMFVLSVSVPWGAHGGGWVNFVAVFSFINSTLFYLSHLFHTVPPVFDIYFVELIAYGVLSFFLLVAAIVVATMAAYSGALTAATVFAFFCLITYLIDAVMQALSHKAKFDQRNERRMQVPTHEPTNI